MSPLNPAAEPERLATGVPGLDDMLHGGFIKGDAVLVAGSPGTGKTTLGLQYLAAGIAAGEPGILVTFEMLPAQLIRDGESRGYPIRQWEEEGMLRVLCTRPDALLAEVGGGKTILDEIIQETGARRLVLDSMTHFEFAGMENHRLRESINGLMNHLRLLDVTPLVTHEIPQIVGPAMTVSDYGLEFLVDAVIILRYVELDGQLDKAINVLKFRGSGHDRSYRPLVANSSGIGVQGQFEGVENISSGAATKSVTQRAKELI